ncbi:MAG: dTDP-glucose 4,6-dehydratase [Promethearchaeota archaeon]|jgi:dTDP-glucose 4,6-dehydratase
MTNNVLITGAAGFIGSHIVEHFIRKTDFNIYIIDKLTYASNGLNRLRDSCLLSNERVKVYTFDLAAGEFSKGVIQELGDINYIIHLAAESHVDNSVSNPVYTMKNNIMSTIYLLEYARGLSNLDKFIYFSTDEVYASSEGGISYKENDFHKPTNPYSASKSASEKLCMGYHNTYKIPLIRTNTMNCYGERQHVEKFIPKCIKYILDEKCIDIHADIDCVTPGSRSYIHARNVADAILFILHNGDVGEGYNIMGEKEMNNLEMASFIANVIGKDLKHKLVDFHSGRPEHDLEYRLDGSKLRNLGWKPPTNIEESLTKTIQWTLQNTSWLNE